MTTMTMMVRRGCGAASSSTCRISLLVPGLALWVLVGVAQAFSIPATFLKQKTTSSVLHPSRLHLFVEPTASVPLPSTWWTNATTSSSSNPGGMSHGKPNIIVQYTKDDDDGMKYDDQLFVWAAVPPVLAFLFQDVIAKYAAYYLDTFGFAGSNVDGNKFATDLLRPTVNGVVVPATAIVLGTLFATTVNVLWNRQLTLRTTINKEAAELRLLRRAIFGCFGTAQHAHRRAAALQLLHSYTKSIIAECQVNGMALLENIQMEGNGISCNELDELADMLHGVDGAAAARQGSVATAEGLLVSLNGHRSERVATMLSAFPRLHWTVLLALFLGINVAFVIDSNQEVLQYLNSVQLRVLFAIIIGVGSGSAALLKDLQEPFQGSFCINSAAQQIGKFEQLLASDIEHAIGESRTTGPISWPTTLDRQTQRPKYNSGNTLYFHLLTGPLAANVRIFSELWAWFCRKSGSVWESIKQRWQRMQKKTA